MTEFIDLRSLITAARERVTRSGLLALVSLMADIPSPAGGERDLANAIVAWGHDRYPDLEWRLDTLSANSASVLSRSLADENDGSSLLLYSHLDTSLSGDPRLDFLVTGELTPSPGLELDASSGLARGFGLGVAKGPAAAATLGYLAAAAALREARVGHHLTLLLAAGGTHRASPPALSGKSPGPIADGHGIGVQHVLQNGLRVDAVVNAKCGPPGVLAEEPGNMFVTVHVTGPWAPAIQHDDLVPSGGPLRWVGLVIDEIERWREHYLLDFQSRRSNSQVLPEAAIGAVTSGLTYKPDLVPGLVNIHLYVVTVDDVEPAAVVEDLERWLVTSLSVGPLAHCGVSVVYNAHVPAGCTAQDAPVVRAAVEAYRASTPGAPGLASPWSGSTDGVLFRAAGIDTARVGPQQRVGDDPRTEVLSIDDLMRCAQLYAEIAIRYLCTPR